jgi:DNA (cytosine-5)-methyltransferase 1
MPRLLDLFCGAGGATRGYQFAGFHVTGIDNKPQPRYCGDAFYQADALDYLAAHGHEFDVIHASPPCQAFSDMRHAPAAKDGHPRLIAPVRDALRRLSRPYVIENVEGAPLIDPVMLCGSQFGLGVAGFQLRRHRLFESTIPLHPRACCHDGPVIGV